MSRPKGRSLSLELGSVSSCTPGSATCVDSVWVELDGIAFLLGGPACLSVVSIVLLVGFLGLYLCGPPL